MVGEENLREEMLKVVETFLLECIHRQQTITVDISLFEQLRHATFHCNRKKNVDIEVYPCTLGSIRIKRGYPFGTYAKSTEKLTFLIL